MTTQPVLHSPAALFLKPSIEIVETGKPRHRHHEVATAIADQTLDLSFIIAFAGTAEAIGKQVGPVGPKLRFWPSRRTFWERGIRY
jgi:hypothetical protein